MLLVATSLTLACQHNWRLLWTPISCRCQVQSLWLSCRLRGGVECPSAGCEAPADAGRGAAPSQADSVLHTALPAVAPRRRDTPQSAGMCASLPPACRLPAACQPNVWSAGVWAEGAEAQRLMAIRAVGAGSSTSTAAGSQRAGAVRCPTTCISQECRQLTRGGAALQRPRARHPKVPMHLLPQLLFSIAYSIVVVLCDATVQTKGASC